MAIQQRGTAMFACLGFLSLVLTAFPPAKALAKGGASTPTQDALASESVVVRNHLHVFALMKAIYRQLGQEDTFADIVAMDAQAKDPAYARAWALLESPGTEQTLVNEVRAAATRISGQSAATD